MIYHVITRDDWEKAQSEGSYAAASLASEGFIHTSRSHQVAGVLERYYKDQDNLLLLHIDETKLTVPMEEELAPSVNDYFPHIFGRLNLDAVIKAEPL